MIKIITLRKFILMLLIVVFQFPSCKQGSNGTVEAKTTKENRIAKLQQIQEGRVIKVYYFHTTYRCYSCTKIEKLTKKALKKNFSKQLKSRKIVFKTINIDQDQNKHFIKDYQLFTKTVVLVDFIKGKEKKWTRLDKTWNYLQEPDVFDKYIKDEVITFINKN